MESAGGRASARKIFAPQKNMTVTIASGIAVQTISSGSDPWISGGRSSSDRRRNLTAKYAMHRKMSVEKNTATPHRKKNSTSTDPAIVEARGGKSGNVISGVMGSRAPSGT